jgi:phosphoglycolate phosphatase
VGYELIVFDWDGTLMDSQTRIVSCIQGAFEGLGLAAPSREAASEVIGLALEEALARLCPGCGRSELAELVAGYRRRFLVTDTTPSEPFFGARETLELLAGQGRLLAVATGKSRAGLANELVRTGFGPLFQATRCADETFSKPHPQMLLELMDELGVAASDTLMVGDTEYDMQMAANAQVDALAVSWGVHPPERLAVHGPIGCLRSLDEIADWVEPRVPLTQSGLP